MTHADPDLCRKQILPELSHALVPEEPEDVEVEEGGAGGQQQVGGGGDLVAPDNTTYILV